MTGTMSNKDYIIWPRKMKSFLDSKINKSLKAKDFTASQIPFIIAIAEREGLSMKDLCVELGIDKGLATRVVKALIENGHVVNKSESSRTYKLYLTDKGVEAFDFAMMNLEQTLEQVLECLDEQELGCLKTISRKLNNRLDELHKY
jgi:DNA-binding MarR family transcriptional regulator